jgi:hypothetical protein
LRLTLQQFAHQPRAKKARGAGDEDEFFVLQWKPASMRGRFKGL